jgi:hypothetical protein
MPFFALCREIPSWTAICRLLSPSRSKAMTSCSRGLGPFQILRFTLATRRGAGGQEGQGAPFRGDLAAGRAAIAVRNGRPCLPFPQVLWPLPPTEPIVVS